MQNGNEEQMLDLVVVEDYVKAGKPVPPAKTYRIRVDKTHYDVHKPVVTGQEILALSNKSPQEWKLYQIFRGRQPEPILPDQNVDLRGSGVERFTTVPKDPSEGLVEEKPRRDFSLPENDVEYLNALELKWETRKDNSGMWLVVHGWGIPPGYNASRASIALPIPNDFPDTQIDMALFSPPLSRVDSIGIANLTMANVAGEQWQQWSRHRTGTNPWRPGVDDVSSHLSLVDDWLRREFNRS